VTLAARSCQPKESCSAHQYLKYIRPGFRPAHQNLQLVTPEFSPAIADSSSKKTRPSRPDHYPGLVIFLPFDYTPSAPAQSRILASPALIIFVPAISATYAKRRESGGGIRSAGDRREEPENRGKSGFVRRTSSAPADATPQTGPVPCPGVVEECAVPLRPSRSGPGYSWAVRFTPLMMISKRNAELFGSAPRGSS